LVTTINYDPEACFSGGYWVVPSWCTLIDAECACSWAASNAVEVRLELWDNTAGAFAESTADLYVMNALANAGANARFMLPTTPGHQLYWRLHVMGAGPISPWGGDLNYVKFCSIG
jgi:hypothetical protein